jgi:methyl-accepting chemotaxis protein
MADVASIVIRVVDDGASGVLSGLSGLFGGLVHTAEMAGVALVGLGVAAAALGGEAVKSAADYQTMTTQIANNTTMTTADIATMNSTIKQLSAESGAPLDQLANGFMHAFNMMGNASDATIVLDTAMKSAVSTGSNVSDVTETLAKVMHQFSVPTKDAAKTMDELHQQKRWWQRRTCMCRSKMYWRASSV